jgi:hypothetical protein
MNRLVVLAAIAMVVAAAANCATITKGSRQTISITSNVDGADILLDGMKIGSTPFTGEVPKGKKILLVKKDGYKDNTIALSRSIEPMFWGNIITGGTLGSITDFATGSAYQYAPASYQVDLRAEGQAQADFERSVAARKFAMIYVDRIAADLARGSGDYLDALLSIVNGDGHPRVTADGIRRALVSSDAQSVRFGNKVVGLI